MKCYLYDLPVEQEILVDQHDEEISLIPILMNILVKLDKAIGL